jgi:hypothetical protein
MLKLDDNMEHQCTLIILMVILRLSPGSETDPITPPRAMGAPFSG